MLDYYRFKEVYELFLKGRKEEARHLLMELQSKYIDVCDENTVLKSQVQEFEDILYLSKNLIFDGSFYWLITGSIKQGPFCEHCYNNDGLLIRLNDDSRIRKCYSCGNVYSRESDQVTVSRGEESVAATLRPAKVIPLYK